MKVRKQSAKRKSIIKGASTTFNIMGGGIEERNQRNVEVSWYNVGIYYKRAMDRMSINGGYQRRFLEEGELETY